MASSTSVLLAGVAKVSAGAPLLHFEYMFAVVWRRKGSETSQFGMIKK